MVHYFRDHPVDMTCTATGTQDVLTGDLSFTLGCPDAATTTQIELQLDTFTYAFVFFACCILTLAGIGLVHSLWRR